MRTTLKWLAILPTYDVVLIYCLVLPIYLTIGVILWRRFWQLRDTFSEAGYVGGMILFAVMWPLLLVQFAVVMLIAFVFWLFENLFRLFRCTPAKYVRTGKRFGLQAEHADLGAQQIVELTDEQKERIKLIQRVIDAGTLSNLPPLARNEAEHLIALGLCKPAPAKDERLRSPPAQR